MRAAKGHEIDPRTLSYKTGDEFRACARGRSTQLAVFLDSTGRAYSLPAHTLPSARGQGEPLSGRLDPPDGATFPGVLIGEPEDRWVLASGAGYGFVVKLEDLHSRNRAGKAVLNVPEGSRRSRRRRCRRRDERAARGREFATGGCWCSRSPTCRSCRAARATRSSASRPRSRWSSAETLLAIAAVAPGQTLRGALRRAPHEPDVQGLGEYRGERGQRGAVLPRGWRKVGRAGSASSGLRRQRVRAAPRRPTARPVPGC